MSGVVLVTGGSRGIGAATSRLAAERGYAVAVNYASDAAAADAVVRDIEKTGGRALAVQADVADADQVAGLFDATEGALGPITALVNNAGIAGPVSRLDEADPAMMQRVVDINVVGSILCAREAVRRMSTKHGGRGGAIVNISSAAATLGSAGQYVWYAATKGAIDSFTLGLGNEVAAEGVRVNAVAPGLIDTEIHAASGLPDRVKELSPMLPMRRAGRAEEVAEAVLWLLSGEASYIAGTVLRVAGGR